MATNSCVGNAIAAKLNQRFFPQPPCLNIMSQHSFASNHLCEQVQSRPHRATESQIETELWEGVIEAIKQLESDLKGAQQTVRTLREDLEVAGAREMTLKQCLADYYSVYGPHGVPGQTAEVTRAALAKPTRRIEPAAFSAAKSKEFTH